MKLERYFYASVAAFLLLLTLVGFQRFYFHGRGFDGGTIPPVILALVVTHGLAISAWIVMFFVETLLIATRNRAVHMKLGWVGAGIPGLIAVSGTAVAIISPRTRGDVPIFGVRYSQFMLPMLTEIVVFSTFVALGVVYRRKPAPHRAMMLLATLSVISGATSRTDLIMQHFGEVGWRALFGPVFLLGFIILLARLVVTRRFDRPFAGGLAAMIVIYIAAFHAAVGPTWTRLGRTLAQADARPAAAIAPGH